MALKSTGIIRKVDDLGRIVIPMEVRKAFDIEVKDPLEIHVEKNRIVLSKHEKSCLFCGSIKNLLIFKGKKVCADCSDALATFEKS